MLFWLSAFILGFTAGIVAAIAYALVTVIREDHKVATRDAEQIKGF